MEKFDSAADHGGAGNGVVVCSELFASGPLQLHTQPTDCVKLGFQRREVD